ncbi:MAG: hypothetical protein IPJ82_10650 [Lewinellaceae bacterium]|nr:hypothetical protein [Lewinellaceae bacterium]
MSRFFILFLLVCFSRLEAATLADTVAPLEIGKRNDWLFSPAIRTENVAKWRSAGNRVFFRTAGQTDFEPIGFLGNRIKPYLTNDPATNLEFRQFRKSRTRGFIFLVIATGSSVYAVVETMNWFTTRAFGANNPDYSSAGLLFGLAFTIGFSIASNLAYIHSERHLLKAVNRTNGLTGAGHPKNRIEAAFGFIGNKGPGMGFQLRF